MSADPGTATPSPAAGLTPTLPVVDPELASGAGGTVTLHDPATGAALADLPLASVAEADRAIARTAAAFPGWRDLAPAERARRLRAFADAVDAHSDELAELEVRNCGHTIGNARWEAGNVRDVLHYYAAAPERLLGNQIPVAGGVDITFREPLGVVGIIVPWNFPMPIAAWGFAPALAAGNTVVLKPAELTPLTALRLAELARDSGLPDDVFTVLPGAGDVVGQRLVTSPAVRKVCFTGSSRVGQAVATGCAAGLKPVTLELGGKSATIIFDDVDLAQAAAAAPMSVFDNAGQDCCARSRILVQRNRYDEFLTLLEPAVAAVRVADPAHSEAQMGPLISPLQHARVAGYVGAADVLFTGSTPDVDRFAGGYWFPPTVVRPTGITDPIWREEVFGPVVAVLPFDDEADAIALANDSPYGLSGSIYTRDVGRALRVARAVESGTLSVNSHSSVRYWTPFGGYKQSGLGRELGPDATDAFTQVKNVFLAT